MYSDLIKQQTTSWGGTILTAVFPAHGTVSVVGSVLGGTRAAAALAKGGEVFATVHAEMLLEGTKKRSKRDIQVLLDEIGASLSFASTHDRLVFNARVRSIHLPKLLSLIAEVLAEPAFPEQELRTLKEREQASLTLEAQDTREQAGQALSRILFQSDHPNWRESTDESRKELKTITVSRLRAYHEALIDTESLVIAIAGDSDPKASVRACQVFGTLPHSGFRMPAFKSAKPASAKRQAIPIADKAGIDYLLGVATGISDSHKDFPAIMLGLQVLGNPGFTGRLMRTIREQEGLTYGAYSYASGFEKNVDGFLQIWVNFAPQLFTQGRAAIWRELKLLVEKGVTAEEVKKHQKLYDARFRVRLSNSGAIARTAHELVTEGESISFLDTFPKKVLRLTAPEVNRALRKYLKLTMLSETAAGPIEKNGLSK